MIFSVEETKKFKCPKCGGVDTVKEGAPAINYMRKPMPMSRLNTKMRECQNCGYYDSEDEFLQINEESKPVCPRCPNSECPNYGKEMEFISGEPEVFRECKCEKCNHHTHMEYLATATEEKCPYIGCGSLDVKSTGKEATEHIRGENGEIIEGQYPIYQCMKCKRMFSFKG